MSSATAESVFAAWSRCSRSVSKPIQYVGGELNSRSRSGTSGDPSAGR